MLQFESNTTTPDGGVMVRNYEPNGHPYCYLPKSDVDATIYILETAQTIGVGGPATYTIGAQVPINIQVVAATATQRLSA